MSSRSNTSTADDGTPANRSTASASDFGEKGRSDISDSASDVSMSSSRSGNTKMSSSEKKSELGNLSTEERALKKTSQKSPFEFEDGKDALRHSSAGSSQLDLQRESLRIEDSIMIAQRVVQFQRSEAQIAIAEALEAKKLAEREQTERLNLEFTNASNAADRMKRKEIKSFLMDVVNLLKDKQMEVKHLKEASEVATSLRTSLQQRRQAYQLLSRQVEDRERIERLQLSESHERTAKNLLVWQELELKQVVEEEKEGSRRINKIKAQQMKELQQKEAEQLRELQHLKAKFSMGQFDMELEFTENFERQKAEQLIELQTADRKHKREKQNLKKKVRDMTEQLRNANEDEMNKQKAESLLQQQELRARELLTQQKHKSSEREKSFESEMKVRAEEFKELISDENLLQNMQSKDSGSGSESGGSQTMKSNSSMGNDFESDQKPDKEMEDLDFNEENRRNDRHKAQMKAYVLQAEESLVKQKEQQHRERKSMEMEHARLNQNTLAEYENRKSLYRQANEQRTMELIKTHNREKGDIQMAHERELEVLKKSIELEKELHTRSLSETQVASQAKSEFLSFVCHELRNPLSGIVAIVDMLLGAKLSVELKNHIDTIKHESELMCAIVNDVLDFAKIEANMLVLDPVQMELTKTVSEMVNEQKLIAFKTKPDVDIVCTIDPNVPAKIVTDPIRLRQVLLNLISNAIKFTFNGSVMVHVSAEGYKASKASIKFEIVDTGVGISETDQEHIFSAFSQANPSTTREFGGTGLGLSISKALVERLGGTIGVESEKGKGTRFYFTIQGEVREDDQEKTKDGSSDLAQSKVGMPKGLKVLVVEDSSTLRRLWAKLLKEQNCIVETATNGMDAIEKCSEVLKKGTDIYDVVLMDITMPVMSGDEAVKKLREMKWKGVVIALTANAMESDREHYLEAGMDAVVTKPFQMNQLRAVINEQLEKRKR